ncbi:glycoside hydrolase family 57 protein [Methanocella sp. MCL-LM]|uniref:glycoside hydrolase family 57 protein n=1 Tax=Methanocella sp. MCL-LM TaxID=3412035 RepID=UPI003C75B8CE
MTRLCIGFEVHQPYRLNPGFRPGDYGGKSPEEAYFSGINKEILERVCRKCYNPATTLVLELLDQGFKCAFSLSGTLVEQLEKWEPETLGLFEEVARHKNAELLCQTYYHSVASLFDDPSEFEEQVRLHRQLMRDAFGVTPTVMENTEFLFNNAIAESAKRLGFKGIYTEGVERLLGWRSPNYVYSCRGINLLLRNYQLSDDIAFRFTNRQWPEWPLTADKYAAWLAATPGDYVNVFIDYETFGEHQWEDTGIFEFLRWLPRECKARGVEFAKPSEIASMQAVEALNVEETVSWADVEKDISAWLGNTMQHMAIKEVQRGQAFASDVKTWRYLQTSDHFYYMASKFGSCGDVHSYFSPEACTNIEAFDMYMRALSDYELRAAQKMKPKQVALELRCLPPEQAFRFRTPRAYTGFSAYSLDDFADLLNFVPEDSLQYHLSRDDYSVWVRDVLNDGKLAEEVAKCGNRIELLEVTDRRRKELWSRLKGAEAPERRREEVWSPSK